MFLVAKALLKIARQVLSFYDNYGHAFEEKENEYIDIFLGAKKEELDPEGLLLFEKSLHNVKEDIFRRINKKIAKKEIAKEIKLKEPHKILKHALAVRIELSKNPEWNDWLIKAMKKDPVLSQFFGTHVLKSESTEGKKVLELGDEPALEKHLETIPKETI